MKLSAAQAQALAESAHWPPHKVVAMARGVDNLEELAISMKDQLAIEANRPPLTEGEPGGQSAGSRSSPPGSPLPSRMSTLSNALERSAGGFSNFGEFIRLIAANPGDERLVPLNIRAMSAEAGATGGFLIPSEWSSMLSDEVDYTSIVRQYVRSAPRTPERPDAEIDLPLLDYTKGRFGGVEVGWIGEGQAKPESEAAFQELHLRPKEVAGYTELTDKLIRNVPGISTLLASLFSQALAQTMDDAYLNGDGVNCPLGVLGHPACISVARKGAGLVAYDDLVNMIARSRGRAKRWVISQTVIAQIAMATLPGGLTPLWTPSFGEWGSVLGFPVDVWEAAPTLGSLGDILLVDWSYYVVKDGVELSVDVSSSHAENFIANRSVLKAFAGTDGQPWLKAPITLADGATTVSPFVALAA